MPTVLSQTHDGHITAITTKRPEPVNANDVCGGGKASVTKKRLQHSQVSFDGGQPAATNNGPFRTEPKLPTYECAVTSVVHLFRRLQQPYRIGTKPRQAGNVSNSVLDTIIGAGLQCQQQYRSEDVHRAGTSNAGSSFSSAQATRKMQVGQGAKSRSDCLQTAGLA